MKVLIALGGNAILRRGEKGTAEEQIAHVRNTAEQLVWLVSEGDQIAITHGNGPQVGDILLKNEMAKEMLPPMPLDVCGAESQGMIGYMLQQAMDGALRAKGIRTPVVTVMTQTLVDRADPAFGHPTKPIGPFYSEAEATRLRAEKGWTVINDSGRGYRRVVPSPTPVEFVEGEVLKSLFESGVIVIASGGGGVPVTRDDSGKMAGVEAVLDKDRSAALLASLLGVDVLLILTDVDKVYLDYGKPSARPVTRMSLEECKGYLAAGQFPEGSMGPKVESATRFVEAGGKKSIITSLSTAKEALAGRAGTTISRDT